MIFSTILKKTITSTACVLVSLAMVNPVKVFAAPQQLDHMEIKQVVNAIKQQLLTEYVSAEHAEEIALLLDKKIIGGAYNKFTDPLAFSKQLTKDLRSINQDGHLSVSFEPERISAKAKTLGASKDVGVTKKDLRHLQRNNYGFKEVSILPGNIGYINLTNFHDPALAGDTAVAAMNYVANTDAIIFDLRENGGGREAMFQLIASYLYSPEPVLLNNMYQRSKDKSFQTWVLPYVPGKRRPDVDVYILTSDYTYSAAEAFSYSLKHLDRATIVGETTGGGAHAGSPSAVSERFTLWLPRFKIINPVTKSDWEGRGVVPDIQTTKEAAFDTAYAAALERLIDKYPHEANINQLHLDRLKGKTQASTPTE